MTSPRASETPRRVLRLAMLRSGFAHHVGRSSTVLRNNASQHSLRYQRPAITSSRRTLWTDNLTLFQPLKEGFLDLSLALPWPVDFPQYTSTIILVSVLSRLVFTLPFSVWVRAVLFVLFLNALKYVIGKETAMALGRRRRARAEGLPKIRGRPNSTVHAKGRLRSKDSGRLPHRTSKTPCSLGERCFAFVPTFTD